MTVSSSPTHKSRKVLTVFSLVMINVIVVDSIRTLPIAAEYGLSLVFYYLLAAIVFFLPTALVSAELASTWPETGGIYIWTREAFGYGLSFLTIWLQWFYNIFWYPTILSLVAGVIAYCVDPSLVHSRLYMVAVVVIGFWLATIINLFGMKASGILTTLAAIIGTLIPMLMVIVLGVVWFMTGHPLQISFSWQGLLPDLSKINNLVLLIGVLFGFIGMEVSAVHASEVKNPKRDYPLALFYSVIIILASMILASLAIAIVIPQKNLSLVAGIMQAFNIFFSVFHLRWFMPVLAVMVVLGALGGIGAWVIGPAKGLLVASQDGSIPPLLKKTNRYHAPYMILIIQALIVTLLSLAFLLMPSVNSGFWLLSDITAILSLLVYVLMFPAAIYLRFKYPHIKRSFSVPGGKVGMCVIAGVGLITTLLAIGIGFIPPAQVSVGNIWRYEVILVAGVVISCLLPIIIYSQRRPIWRGLVQV